MRASIYNAMPIEGVQKLALFMKVTARGGRGREEGGEGGRREEGEGGEAGESEVGAALRRVSSAVHNHYRAPRGVRGSVMGKECRMGVGPGLCMRHLPCGSVGCVYCGVHGVPRYG